MTWLDFMACLLAVQPVRGKYGTHIAVRHHSRARLVIIITQNAAAYEKQHMSALASQG